MSLSSLRFDPVRKPWPRALGPVQIVVEMRAVQLAHCGAVDDGDPLELRYLIHKESAAFFQEARLDKQSLVDRLEWSGATLYDLCNLRLAACSAEDPP